MKTERVNAWVLRSAVLAVVAAVPFARAADINWVGYQYGNGAGGFRTSASWFDGDQWFNSVVPGAADLALFDISVDPQGNGMPRDVYFGDFLVTADPPFIPTAFTVPGGAAQASAVWFRNGEFRLFFESSMGVAQGSLSVANAISVSAGSNQVSSVTLLGGPVTSQNLSVAGFEGGSARMTLQGAQYDVSGLVDVGVLGARGELFVESNSLLSTGYLRVGENGGSNGLMKVSGMGAVAEIEGGQIGATGTGRLEILAGGVVKSSATLNMANFGNTARGSMLVSGAGSRFVSSGLSVGNDGEATVTVENGGRIERPTGVFSSIALGSSASGGRGELLVAAPGSSVEASDLYLDRSSQLRVSDSGSVRSDNVFVSDAGSIQITGVGSEMRVAVALAMGTSDSDVSALDVVDGGLVVTGDAINVGFVGRATMRVSGGGVVDSRFARVARLTGSNGTAEIGNGGKWTSATTLFVGGHTATGEGGVGLVTVSAGGLVTAATGLRTWSQGTVDVSQGGKVVIGAANPADVPNGTVWIGSGGLLAGTGTIIGDVVISGGELAPGQSPGVMNVTGDLNLLGGSVSTIEIASTTSFDQILATGDVVLGGQLLIRFLANYAPSAGDTFPIFDPNGSVVGQFSGIVLEGIDPTLVSIDSGSGSFSVNVIPEPGVAGLLVVATGAFLRRRRA